VQELGGLVFPYLGPQPAPELPRYDLFVWDDAWPDIGHAELPCNFVQIMETPSTRTTSSGSTGATARSCTGSRCRW
jgi:hypothetical protein